MATQGDAKSLTDIFSNLLTYQKGGDNANAQENTPLFASTATTHQGIINETVQKIQRLNESAPYSFRVLGLVGGIAMLVSNSLAIFGRILTLNFTAAIISVYCAIFGTIIILLEADTITEAGTWPDGRRLQEGIRFYCKFLEYSWGRGLLYFFVGTLQSANWNLIDWIVGRFMMFVGISACASGIKTAQDLRRLRVKIRNERDLKAR